MCRRCGRSVVEKGKPYCSGECPDVYTARSPFDCPRAKPWKRPQMKAPANWPFDQQNCNACLNEIARGRS